jgi:hypothetical protein
MKGIIILIILTVALIPTPAQAQGHRVMTATIEAESGRRTVEIRYYAESEEWAKDILRTITEGFPLLEKRIGVLCPTTYDIIVEETTSLKAGVGGENRGPLGLLVPTGTPAGTIIHELCHYWFGYHYDLQWSNWIFEGFSEAYTVSILKELNHPKVYDYWYFRLIEYEVAKAALGGDTPLSEVGYAPDFEDPRVPMLYSKSMVFCSWFLLYIGEEQMHTINEKIIDMNPLRTEDYQAAAEEVTGQQLDWLFSGWVYQGGYYYDGRPVSFEWFVGDGDKDGIGTLDEIERGSSPFTADTDNDGLPDGYELVLRTDVENADTDNDGLKDGEEVAIIIDGKNTEWKTPIIEDDEDSKSLHPQDMKSVYYAADDSFMYFMIECYNNIDITLQTGIVIGLEVGKSPDTGGSEESADEDDERSPDFFFFVFYDHLFMDTWEQGSYTEISDPALLKGVFVIADQVIEFRIPKKMEQIRFPDEISVWALEYSVVDQAATDETPTGSIVLDKNVETKNPLVPEGESGDTEDASEPADAGREEPKGTDTEPEPLPQKEPQEVPEEGFKTIIIGGVIFLGLVVVVGYFLSKRRSKTS